MEATLTVAGVINTLNTPLGRLFLLYIVLNIFLNMTQLSDLPTEIIDQIVGYLPRSDRLKLSLTS